MDIQKEVSRVMTALKSADVSKVNCSSSLYGALIMMRTTLIKSKETRVRLVQAGCIPRLLDLLAPPTATGSWLKTVDIVISILANMCLEEEEARKQVISSKGLSTIVEATKCTEKESIHNRGVRAVANLMQHSSRSEEICNEVIDLEFHIFVSKRLMETKDKECKQTYLRAVRLLGQQKGPLIKLIDSSRSVQAVASLLKEGDEKLKNKSLRILHDFSTLRCCANFVEQILAANILEELVQAAKSSDDDISALSLSTILKLCEYENIRPPLGAAGLISTFMHLLECERSHINHISILNALCLCCFEAVNRHRLYQEKTLELFMLTLNSEELTDATGKFSVLRDRILSCLVCFLYNDECFDKLLDLNLVTTLIGHLKRVCNLQLLDDKWSKEVEMILNEEKNDKVKETTVDEDENGVEFDCDNDQNDRNVNSSIRQLKDLHNIIEECAVSGIDDNGATTEISNTPDHLDQEIMDISVNDTEVIPPSGTQDSRHTFSIDSPTYQMEQHSWRLEDHTSGITCKNYSEDFNKDEVVIPKPSTEGFAGKFSPYSPLSVGSSYYSPAYPSPAHSIGSSPRHSNFQTGSFCLGSQSPRSSPTWSPTNSLHSEDTWSNSDPAGSSPSNLIHSPNSQQGQFSPLINPYPASSPPMFLLEDRNIPESLLHNSQVSNASNRTLDSQEDIFSEYSKPLFSDTIQQSGGRFSSLSENFKGENLKPIYSASEDEDEEDDSHKCDEDWEPKGKRVKKVEDSYIENGERNPAAAMEIQNCKETKGKDRNCQYEPSVSGIRSTDFEIHNDNVTLTQSLFPNTSLPFVRLNSEPCLGVSSLENESLHESHMQNEANVENVSEKTKQLNEDVLSSPQVSGVKGYVKSGKRLFSKQFSFPGKSSHYFSGDKPSPPHSLSPYRVSFELPFNSPSMSPFSRYGNSPYASPNPYHPHVSQNISAGEDGFVDGLSKSDEKSPRKLLHSALKTCSHSSLHGQPSCSYTSQEDSQSQNQNFTDQPSNSKSDREKDIERLNRIKRKSEENIFVLLSRISIKTDPSQHLPKYTVLSALTQYLCVAPIPIQRCIRTLFRVFHNPHCFESVLLEQAPALIVKNLIMDQDGRFPSVLFADQQGNAQNGPQTNRKINFDDLFSCSQSSETPSDFELQIQFEFGGDAYSNMTNSRSFRSDIFQPNYLLRGKSIRHGMSRDSSNLYSLMTPEDLIRARIRSGINLMKAITSLALSRYGNGEIQRIWSRGTESEKLMCAISLLHMPIGCGPLHRRQIILRHDALHLLIPFMFCQEAPLVRESIVTALSLLAHLLRIQKETPKVDRLTNTCPELGSCGSTSADFDMSAEKNGNSSPLKNVPQVASCNFERNSDKFNLNLIVEAERSQERRVFRACKEILMKKSDVFAAMLGGGYAEAGKVDIEFSDVNLSGFEYVLHYLHGCESGCVVIDSLSLVDSGAGDCDKDCELMNESNAELDPNCPQYRETDVKNDAASELSVKLETECSQTKQSDGTPLEESLMGGNGKDASLEIQVVLDKPTTSSYLNQQVQGESKVQENKTSFSSSNSRKQRDSETSLLINNSPISPMKQNENNNLFFQRMKQIDAILDKCIDVMTVADRFLVHDLTQYLTSVLSHTCLYTRSVMDIICLASTYKLTTLATDCVVEVLLSRASRKDITELFKVLGLELDSDTKRMLIDILTNMFTVKASCP